MRVKIVIAKGKNLENLVNKAIEELETAGENILDVKLTMDIDGPATIADNIKPMALIMHETA